MPQNIDFNFAQGLDTKTDPWQLPTGKFLTLENSIFQKGGLLTKRKGYQRISGPPENISYLTTLNDNLLAIGDTVSAEVESLNEFVTKGNLQPCSLSVSPMIRNNLNQIQSDSVISNGLILLVYSQVGSNGSTISYFYTIQDAITQQNIVLPSSIPLLAGGTRNVLAPFSRVFLVANFFVIVTPVTVAGTTYLQYVSIPTNTPTLISTPKKVINKAYVPYLLGYDNWDGVVNDDGTILVISYNTTDGGQAVHVASLTSSQIAAGSTTTVFHSFAGSAAQSMSVCADLSQFNNVFYISFFTSSSGNSYTAAVTVSSGLITALFIPQLMMTSVPIVYLTSAAQNGVCTVFYDVTNEYSYDSISSDFINARDISQAGTPAGSAPYVVVRSVSLASQAFIIDGVIYLLTAYISPFQPTFFLINGSSSTQESPVVVSKLAYQNGGGPGLSLPFVTVIGNQASVSYLIKQNVQALSQENNTQQISVGGIYSQIGINVVNFQIGTEAISSSEIAEVLHLSGGFLSMFDGYFPVEHNFFLFPDSVEATWADTGGSIHAQPDGSTNTDAYYYQVTYEWTDAKGLAHRSAPSIAIPVTTTGSGTAGSITLNIPTLRLTQKTFNSVKIVIYRWSVETQVYNQVTSINAPTLNDTTVDDITYLDTLADSSIVGNNIIYTTGGVVPDTNGPANDIQALFDTRLFLVDSEDRNLLWVSKTVIEGTPVEMSSSFTIYIAPNVGTTQSTGGITALFPMDDKLILFKKEAIYYMNGTGPDILGTTSPGCPLGNYSPPVFITSVIGCTNQKSIVLTQGGLIFQTDKGIWSLSRSLEVSYIGAAVEDFNSSTVTSAQVIPGANFVLFSLNTGELLMYDYYYSQWGSWKGTALGNIISSCIYNGLHTILNDRGEILQQTSDQFMDAGNPVLMSFTTSWINLSGSLQNYLRFYEFYFLGKFLSPHQLNVQVAYNYNPSIYHSSVITPRNFSTPIPSPFGVPTPFGSPGTLEQWRIHAKVQLCQSFQITVQEIFNPLYTTIPGEGFTMSGVSCKVELKKATRPIRGSNTAG